MKDKIKKLLKLIYNLNYKFIMKNIILLESNPDFSDNTKAIFDELIKNKYNESFKIIWFVKNKKIFDDVKIKNVKFVERNGSFYKSLRFIYYNIISKYIIDCNRYINKYNKNQFRIHLTHGEWIKVPLEYAQGAGEFDYIIQTSDFFTKATCYGYNIDSKKVVITGFPRNDYLFQDNIDLFSIYPEIEREKIILWLPTYRNHKGHINEKNNYTYYMNINFPYGVPCINTQEELEELNKILKEYKILLLIKLHPAENTSKLNSYNFENIKLIKDSIFEQKHTNLYQLLSITDALITDYSSVYYDYLLMNKPIGLAISDINDYKAHIKLLFDNYEENIAGDYIYNYDDLKKFVKNVGINNDETLNKRIEKKNIYQKYQDDKSAQRVLKILEEKINDEKRKKKRRN